MEVSCVCVCDGGSWGGHSPGNVDVNKGMRKPNCTCNASGDRLRENTEETRDVGR